ncbi:hypothetical protein EJ063_12750 [Vibrio aquaticus]|uniref:Uncharacterized protein n=1 Tax=Vibrio aquaticus TaxID=2496559 RepID=A0A3S0Q125_9VIBR|nr:hypothetical protein [Vibrio aquaticus]RTZ15323.1 hypothetical protein EJ063_12750 [Vibrio aquaticus]
MNDLVDLIKFFCGTFAAVDEVVIPQVTGHYKFLSNDEEVSSPYRVAIVVDIQHMMYHMVIAAQEIDDNFYSEYHQIKPIIDTIAADYSRSRLHDEPLAFTNIVFTIADKIHGDRNRLAESFSSVHNVKFRGYLSETKTLNLVSPKIKYVPAETYDESLASGDRKLVVNSANYQIYLSSKGKISTCYHAMNSSINHNLDAHKDLEQLQSLRDELETYTHSDKERNEYSDIVVNAVVDAFKGDVEQAKGRLKGQIAHQIEKKESRNLILTIVLFSIAILATFITSINPNSEDYQFVLRVICSSTLGGLFFSLIDKQLVKQCAHLKITHFLSEVSVKLIVSIICGFILTVLTQANLVMGKFADDLWIMLGLSFVAGWSQTLVPNLLSRVEKSTEK